ncbi:1,3-beta-glucan synthase component-domain-containing protein [Lactarius deliciosus]|nr:1,3-beta-glucan synthase component-domain-containing protein [Lactarius deliciosus]
MPLTIAATTIGSGHSVNHVHPMRDSNFAFPAQNRVAPLCSGCRFGRLGGTRMSLPLAETYILQDPGNVGSVQAQGPCLTDLERDHYHNVSPTRASRAEAERWISFFAQSLTTALPEALPVDTMPNYNEKILFSLREIIKESDINTRVTLLEYPKQLHGLEWENFVRDTKILAQESEMYDGALRAAPKVYPAHTHLGFVAFPDAVLHVSGMMNYRKVIKLLYRIENPEVVQMLRWQHGQTRARTRTRGPPQVQVCRLHAVVLQVRQGGARERRVLVARLPGAPVQITYFEEEPRKDGGEPRLYFALINSEFNPQTSWRKPNLKFRIELPENPICTNKGGGGGV